MNSKITPVFLFLSLSLLIWTTGYSLSLLTAQHQHPQSARGSAMMKSQSNPELTALKQEAQSSTGDIRVQLALAAMLEKKALEEESQQYLMEAVEAYTKALDIDPKNKDALLGLANLCARTGIVDKALIYFGRYLELEPGDLLTKSDFALTLLQAGDSKKSQEVVSEILKKDPKLFRAQLVQFLLYKVAADGEKTEKQAALLKTLASSAEEKEVVEKLINAKLGASKAESVQDKARLSPADAVEQYFKSHSIVGPKLQGISWVAADRVEVRVKEFPVDKMPEFARQKFIGSIKAEFEKLSQNFTVVLKDQDTSQSLLEVPIVGVNK